MHSILSRQRACGALLLLFTTVMVAQMSSGQVRQRRVSPERLIAILDLPTHRDQAIEELKAMGRRAVVPLLKAARGRDPQIAAGAVQALASMENLRELIAPMMRTLLEQPGPPAARVHAARYLGGSIDEDATFAAFVKALDTTRNDQLTIELVHQLTTSKKHQRRVAEILANRLTRRTDVASLIDQLADRKKTRDAFYALRRRQAETLPELISALRTDDRTQRAQLIRLIQPMREHAVPALLAALSNTHDNMRNAAIKLLTRPVPVDRTVGNALFTRITEAHWDKDDRRRFAAGLFLCMKDDEVLRERVFSRLREGVATGAPSFLSALMSLPKQRDRVEQELRRLAPRATPPVALAVIAALEKRAPGYALRKEVVPLALNHRDPSVVAAAIQALSRDVAYESPGEARIKELADHEDSAIKAAAADYLRLLNKRAAFKNLSFLVADYSDNRIMQISSEGKVMWSLDEMYGVWDAERLANGNFLITEFSINRVTEIDAKGKRIWQFRDLKNPYDADRLANGNTLIADTFGRRVIEVDKSGKIVWTYDNNVHPYDVERLENGNTLIADTRLDRIIEVDKAGKIVWEVDKLPNVHDVDRLPNGNTLVTIRMLNEVREIDRDGKTVFAIKNLSSPSDADRLPDGSTLVAENGYIRIFSSEGIPVWTKKVTWAVEVNAIQGK